ncbi:Protein atp11, mitochondrial [Sphaceloma murrayae]|uniref:Protein atp11, mitochondrial n=1 Tax=Sphaceloma murrayae TaxID=2082308 RepID=A0A2K1QTR9_9PEZI|nr:Protein atp11, mitochondrial [Sphaceloma murrayae]
MPIVTFKAEDRPPRQTYDWSIQPGDCGNPNFNKPVTQYGLTYVDLNPFTDTTKQIVHRRWDLKALNARYGPPPDFEYKVLGPDDTTNVVPDLITFGYDWAGNPQDIHVAADILDSSASTILSKKVSWKDFGYEPRFTNPLYMRPLPRRKYRIRWSSPETVDYVEITDLLNGWSARDCPIDYEIHLPKIYHNRYAIETDRQLKAAGHPGLVHHMENPEPLDEQCNPS